MNGLSDAIQSYESKSMILAKMQIPKEIGN